MAGNTKAQRELDLLRETLAKRDEEIHNLKALLAQHAPQALEDDSPPPVQEYSPDIDQTILEWGKLGMTESETVARLGISQDEWMSWKQMFPTLGQAVARARGQAVAYWDRIGREALANNNNRFPWQGFRSFKDGLSIAGSGGATGDASELVHIITHADAEKAKPA